MDGLDDKMTHVHRRTFQGTHNSTIIFHCNSSSFWIACNLSECFADTEDSEQSSVLHALSQFISLSS